MRSLIAILAAAFIGLAFVSTDASARPFGGHGFHGGGFHGGFHGGFRGRGFGPLLGVGVGLGLAASYPYWGYPGYYGYGDGCLVPRRVWTPWGPRVRWINVCY
ncbi:MAG: sulfur globule protein precursor [Alphaproteobacteria bacterium]|nr:MAG: sulfur globule protein precursor [Alphaproteobacteria bacterium]